MVNGTVQNANDLSYLLKIRWNFDQTLKNENCKVQKSYLTDGDNKRFKVKISLFHPYFVFCIFQFAFCILHSIARNPQDFEQLRFIYHRRERKDHRVLRHRFTLIYADLF